MPELAEVETIVRALTAGGRGGVSILGCSIVQAALFWERTLATPDPSHFLSRLPGQRIESIGRRAKFVVIELSRDFLIIHLRMSGDLRVENNQDSVNDPRKFGRVWLTETPDDVLGALGPEPFDESLTPKILQQMLHERRRLLKPLLMDQHFLAGLGNIYTDESLFSAQLHPLMLSDQVTPRQAENLLTAIRSVLMDGIQRNGASIDWVYRGGDFQNNFKVYQRNGEPCYNCGTIIERMTVGQRGTHFCPTCQRLSVKYQ